MPVPSNRLLLVEGRDDEMVIRNIWGELAHHAVNVKQYQGVNGLLDVIGVTIKTCGPDDRLGVVIDADADLSARWQSLRHRLKTLDVQLPDQPSPGGLIVESENSPRVGIWVMPDNRQGGTLEDFITLLVDDGGAILLAHANRSIDSIPDGHVRFPIDHRTKAVIHTYLAWQKEPGKPMGQALAANYLSRSAEAAEAFRLWLQRCFVH